LTIFFTPRETVHAQRSKPLKEASISAFK